MVHSKREAHAPVTEHQLQLSAGPLDYLDTGGSDPVVVLLHGLLMDASLWDGVLGPLSSLHRCIVPTLPLGAHRHPMAGDADFSLTGLARLVLELLDTLSLKEVTLVGNDTGGAIAQVLVHLDASRIARLVLISCEAFNNLPPGLTGRTVAMLGKLPPRLLGLFMQQMRLKPVRRLPLSFGWLTKRGDSHTKAWMRSLQSDQAIRRDATRMIRVLLQDTPTLETATQALADYNRPALVIWANDDRVMPVDHARRLARLLPQGDLRLIEDSYTLVPLDQPTRLASALGGFISATAR